MRNPNFIKGNRIMLILPIVFTAIVTTSSFAQRTCGTTEYYQHRLQVDPSLADRMAAEESKLQEWIKTHPQNNSVPATELHTAKFPHLFGFTPTGDEKIDRLNYAKAKEAYKLSQPTQSTSSLLSEEEMKAARAARQKNQLTPIIK
ncbi:MAG: hypothetical protein H0V61_05255 [Chitinophagales bacterium]|nr:hypothetical protein [Chitinophagales bacterium]